MASVTVPACTLKPSLHTRSLCRGRISHSQAFKSVQPRRVIVRAEEPKEGEKDEAGSKAKDPVNKGGTAYIDELPPTPRSEVSPEMKKKLRDEYLGFGGAPNQPLANNWFLYIILGVTFLVALTYITGSV